MAVVARNDHEREFCRLYISGLLQKGGRKTHAVEVWRLLNRRLVKNAKEAAQQAGKSPEEVAEAGEEAGISLQTVRADLRVLLGGAQEAWLAGAAVFLDDQLAQIVDDIEETYSLAEEIRDDLVRTRAAARTRGAQVRKMVEGREITVIEPTEVVREPAAAATLYGRLIEVFRLRQKLRAEERTVRFGRLHVPDPEEGEEEERTLAEIVSEIDDPETARQACLRYLRREMKNLARAAKVPLAGDMAQMNLARTRQMESELRTFREYVRLPPEQRGGKTHRTFEVAFERHETRRLPAGESAEGEEEPDVA